MASTDIDGSVIVILSGAEALQVLSLYQRLPAEERKLADTKLATKVIRALDLPCLNSSSGTPCQLSG